MSLQDTRLMKSAGTSSISVALRSVVVAIFGLVLMLITSVLLTVLPMVRHREQEVHGRAAVCQR